MDWLDKLKNRKKQTPEEKEMLAERSPRWEEETRYYWEKAYRRCVSG